MTLDLTMEGTWLQSIHIDSNTAITLNAHNLNSVGRIREFS